MSMCGLILLLCAALLFGFLAFHERILACFAWHSKEANLASSSNQFFRKDGIGDENSSSICFSPKTIDDFLSNDCDVTYKEFRSSFESSLKKILSPYASNDDNASCSNSSQSKGYTPTAVQDDDDDPDDLA